jgi:hypothetical protein
MSALFSLRRRRLPWPRNSFFGLSRSFLSWLETAHVSRASFGLQSTAVSRLLPNEWFSGLNFSLSAITLSSIAAAQRCEASDPGVSDWGRALPRPTTQSHGCSRPSAIMPSARQVVKLIALLFNCLARWPYWTDTGTRRPLSLDRLSLL